MSLAVIKIKEKEIRHLKDQNRTLMQVVEEQVNIIEDLKKKLQKKQSHGNEN